MKNFTALKGLFGHISKVGQMKNYTDTLIDGLDVQAIIPHKRGAWARDETCFNKTRSRFVAAFNIFEVTMMNEMGNIVWGSISDDQPIVEGYLANTSVSCWERPFAHWLDEKCFAVKVACNYQRPIIAVHFTNGFHILPNLQNRETRASHATQEMLEGNWLDSEAMLRKEICKQK